MQRPREWTLYERINGGHTVEEAVQFGRWEVYNQPHKGRDVAAFGSFVVTTTRAGEVRILRSAQQSPLRVGTGASAKGDGGETGLGPDAQISAEPGQAPDTDEVFKIGKSSGEDDEIVQLRAKLADMPASSGTSPVASNGSG